MTMASNWATDPVPAAGALCSEFAILFDSLSGTRVPSFRVHLRDRPDSLLLQGFGTGLAQPVPPVLRPRLSEPDHDTRCLGPSGGPERTLTDASTNRAVECAGRVDVTGRPLRPGPANRIRR